MAEKRNEKKKKINEIKYNLLLNKRYENINSLNIEQQNKLSINFKLGLSSRRLVLLFNKYLINTNVFINIFLELINKFSFILGISFFNYTEHV